MGEPAIIPNSLVTLIVHMRLHTPGSKLPEVEDENDEDEQEEPVANKEWWVNKESKTPPAYAPHYPGVCILSLFFSLPFLIWTVFS